MLQDISLFCLQKPACGPEIIRHFGGPGKIEEPSDILLIGDRLFTDIVMANLHGMRSMYLHPIDEALDPFTVRLVRKVERLILINIDR